MAELKAKFAPRPADPFWTWFCAEVQAGRTFASLEDAKAEFNTKTPEK